MIVNVYDFDKTIYNGDSSLDFYLFILKKYPGVIRYIFEQGLFFVLMHLKIISKEIGKQHFFCFIKNLKNINDEVNHFWSINKKKLEQWYLSQRQDDDIIISASPKFLLKPICDELNVRLICSLVDEKSGKFKSKNCYGEQKVVRFKKEYPNYNIKKFYSDSKSDQYLAKISEEPIFVDLKKNKKCEWRLKNEKKN